MPLYIPKLSVDYEYDEGLELFLSFIFSYLFSLVNQFSR